MHFEIEKLKVSISAIQQARLVPDSWYIVEKYWETRYVQDMSWTLFIWEISQTSGVCFKSHWSRHPELPAR